MYEDHPIADIFPLMGGSELAQLAESIRQEGLREPIWLYEGQILDGRNRYRACLEAGVEPTCRAFEGSPLQAIEFSWSANRIRRQLSPSQAAVADARREKLLKVYAPVREAAKERQVAGLKRGGERPEPVRQQIAERDGAPDDRKTSQLRAKAAGTNRRYIDLADRLVEERPELADKVGSGQMSLTQAHRLLKAEEVAREVSLPDAKYRVLYADPPWSYGNTQPDYHPGPRDHYPVMKLADICALPIAGICEDNAVLFLWVTSPILEESFQVIRAWGFRYKTSFVWDKIKHNMGHYNSVRHEFLLVCVRGSCPPDVPKLFDSVQSIERTEHSVKPEEFRQIIDTIYPHGKRLELFARGRHEGWDVFGHEAEAPVS
uniref:Putative methyltransferase n=1 Tax=viral metagenome TaxID=1070528 RepID=A0A6M3J3V9_9ZZZZ